MTSKPMLAIPIVLLLAACATPEPLVREPPDAEARSAEDLFRAGRFREAAAYWLELAEMQPEHADRYRLRAAEAWLADGNETAAANLLGAIDPRELAQVERYRLDLARAELALLRADPAAAERLLAQPDVELPRELVARLRMLRERMSDMREGAAASALSALRSAVVSPVFSPETALALLIELPLAELRELDRRHSGDPTLAPWLDLAVTARARLLDDPALAGELAGWQERHPAVSYPAEEARAWLHAFRETIPWPRRIAVILPGSGTLARPSASLRDGMMAAWLELPAARRPELRFHYIDGDPDAVIGAWSQVREENADFVIGPLDRSAVDTVLTLPDPGMPVLLLNQPTAPELLSQIPGQVAALALPPEEEAELAAVHALISGHRHALVLSQATGWGERVADTFIETFTLGGGRVLRRAEYRPAESDHTDMLEILLELDRSRQRIDGLARVIGTQIEAVARRRTDVDLVFMAARADDARQLRPQLRFFDAGDVPVYSTSHIYAGNVRSGSDQDLDGILVPTAPWFIDATAAGQERQRAERMFDGLGNPTLSQLHALGRDALALVPWLAWMQRDPSLYLPGFTGRLRLADGRTLERDLPVARFRNGRLVAE